MRQGVILAGGIGRRLSRITDGKPKYLINVHGRPLIWYPLTALNRLGLEEIIIPVYKNFHSMLEEVLKNLFPQGLIFRLVDIDDYRFGNGYSLLSAVPYLAVDEFILTMADHIFDPEIIDILIRYEGDCVVAADSLPFHIRISEATKLFSDGDNKVLDIGKSIKYFNYIDMGVFKFKLEPLKRLYEQEIDRTLTVSNIIRWMIDNGYDVRLVDLSGHYWVDIDTIDEYWDVERGILKILPWRILNVLSYSVSGLDE